MILKDINFIKLPISILQMLKFFLMLMAAQQGKNLYFSVIK